MNSITNIIDNSKKKTFDLLEACLKQLGSN